MGPLKSRAITNWKTMKAWKINHDLNFIDVYPWLAVLEQFDEDNIVKSTILFNLNDPNTYRSIKLLPNSQTIFCQY